ncbi:hypothetical protein [Brevibacillus reuszeri]|uniref:hypothetical protein n=1 Tax=Brevibacillus reuszeri TaxID=54915 RepID=UPI000CCC8E8C|nr:hypothetical protein [Brevibacillus reuszeri]
MIRIVLIFFLAVTLFGCSKAADNYEANDKYVATTIATSDIKIYKEPDLLTLLDKKVKDDHTIKDNVRITEVLHDERSSFVKFVFEENTTLIEGVAYVTQEQDAWKLEQLAVLPVDSKSPFTHHEYASALNDGTNRGFKIVSGYINEPKIKEIRIIYADREMRVIMIGKNQKTYIDCVIGDTGSIKEISALDDTGKTIFKY